MTRRSLRYAAAALLGGLVLSACAESGIGVAARVGDVRISADEVAERVEAGIEVAPRLPAEEVQRLWASQLVKLRLYEEGARRLGVLPSPEELDRRIDAVIAERGGLQAAEAENAARGIAPRYLRDVVAGIVLVALVGDELVKDKVTPDAQLRKLYDASLVQFDRSNVAHIKVTDKALADRIVKEVRAGADFADLARKHSTDAATSPRGGVYGFIGNGRGPLAQPIVKAIFAAKPGAVIGPLPVQDGFEIFRVIERRTTTFEQAKENLRRSVLDDERADRLGTFFVGLARELAVSVNPRYGRWDHLRFDVLEGGDALSTTVPSPGAGGFPGGPPGGPPGGAPGGPPGAPPGDPHGGH